MSGEGKELNLAQQFVEKSKALFEKKVGRAAKTTPKTTLVALPKSQTDTLLARAKEIVAENSPQGETAEEMRFNAIRRHASYLGIDTQTERGVEKKPNVLIKEVEDAISKRGDKEAELLEKDTKTARRIGMDLGLKVEEMDDKALIAGIKERRVSQERETFERIQKLEGDDLTWYMSGVQALVEDSTRAEVVVDIMAQFDQNIGEVKTAELTGQERDIDKYSKSSKLRVEAASVFLGLTVINGNLEARRSRVETQLQKEKTGTKDEKRIKQLEERLKTLVLIEEQVAPLVYFQEVTQRRIAERDSELKEKGANGQVLRMEEVFGKRLGEPANLLDFQVGVFKLTDKGLGQDMVSIRDLNAWNLGRKGVVRFDRTDLDTTVMEKAQNRPIYLWKLLGGVKNDPDVSKYIETGLKSLFGLSDEEIDNYPAAEMSEGVRSLAKKVNLLVKSYALKEKVSLADVEKGRDYDEKIVLQSMAQQTIADYFSAYLGYVEQKEQGFPRSYIESALKELARATNSNEVGAINVAADKIKAQLEVSLEKFDSDYSTQRNKALASLAGATKFAQEELLLSQARERISAAGKKDREKVLGRERVVAEQLNIEAVYEARLALFKAREIFDSASVANLAEVLDDKEFTNMALRHIGVVLHEVPGVAEALQLAEIRAKYQRYAWLMGVNELRDGKVVNVKKGVIPEVQELVGKVRDKQDEFRQTLDDLRARLDIVNKDPRYKDFQDQERQLAAIETGLTMLAKGTADKIGAEINRILANPTQDQQKIIQEITDIDEQLTPLMGATGKAKDMVKINSLMTQQQKLKLQLTGIQDIETYSVGGEGWVNNLALPDQQALLAKLETTTVNFKEGEEKTLRSIYYLLTGKNGDKASFREIAEELIKTRTEIFKQRVAQAKGDEFLTGIDKSQKRLRKLREKLKEDLDTSDLSIITQELYAAEYLEQLLEEKKVLEEKLFASPKERTMTVSVVENGRLVPKEVVLPAGKSYYDTGFALSVLV